MNCIVLENKENSIEIEGGRREGEGMVGREERGGVGREEGRERKGREGGREGGRGLRKCYPNCVRYNKEPTCATLVDRSSACQHVV